MIINTISLLRQNNEVVVFLNDDQHKSIPCEPWLSELIVSLPSQNLPQSRTLRFLTRGVNKLWRVLLSNTGQFVSWKKKNLRLFVFADNLKKASSNKAYDILIPVESLSLIAADCMWDGSASIIYFDMELLDWGSDNPLYRDKLELKLWQYAALRHVDHVMITSPERARIFAKINKFDQQRISALPVVPLKRAEGEKSRFFREKFTLANEQFVVVYAGNFMPWAQCVEIINSMKTWPDNAVLVMHTWNRQALSSKYFSEMQAAARGLPVYFSTEYLLHDSLVTALTSADAGLLFYEGIDPNFSEICFSSNKMGEYVAAGLPVIASPLPSLKHFVEQQGIGKAVPIVEIGDALRELSENINIYRQNVKKCAETVFSFEEHFSVAWARYEKHAGHEWEAMASMPCECQIK